jgi:divalent metal cation (Fe/Co/Zn/Cd) transporter
MVRLVEVVVVLELLLCNLVELFLKPLASWIINVLIVKLSMKLSCLDYKYYMTWE